MKMFAARSMARPILRWAAFAAASSGIAVAQQPFPGQAAVANPSAAQPASLLQQPAEAPTVIFSAGRLTIHATNSSLRTILTTYATQSGTKINGVSKDERIFGVYGPGSPQEVLSSLLDDSGYNVVIAGRQADGAPREVNLSLQSAVDTAPQPSTLTQAAQDDDDDDAPASQPFAGFAPGPEQQAEQPQHPAAANSQQIKTPQQMLQELQRLREQQEQQNAANAPQ